MEDQQGDQLQQADQWMMKPQYSGSAPRQDIELRQAGQWMMKPQRAREIPDNSLQQPCESALPQQRSQRATEQRSQRTAAVPRQP